MLFVDDVTYIPAGGSAPLELEGYHVYRDGTIGGEQGNVQAVGTFNHHGAMQSPDGYRRRNAGCCIVNDRTLVSTKKS